MTSRDTVEPEFNASANQALSEPMPCGIGVGKCPGRILIMDDEEFILDVTGEVLLELGYEVEVSRDGSEALKKYEQAMIEGKRFDAVIMDLTIPRGLGGREAISLLLEIDPEAKAIISSGHTNDPFITNFLAYGFAGVVPKPYKIKELSQTLDNVLRAARLYGT
jgi:CheY-like chemotaxis protein